LGEYRYYDNCGHGIGASLEVTHGNDAVMVLLNGRSIVLVWVIVDDGGGGMGEGPMTRERTTLTR
jgi:hypothetical protein